MVLNRSSLEASLVDAVQQAVIATDLDGRVIFWNLYAGHLFGWTEQEALGMTHIHEAMQNIDQVARQTLQ